MARNICILHANCQGDALRPLLENTPAFARHFSIRQYTNYTRQELAEADLAQCRLFLHQYLGPRWGELSTEELLPRLSPQCRSLRIPNLFFKGYWPWWMNSQSGKDKPHIDFADSLLEELLARGLDSGACLALYLRGEPQLLGDVAAIAEDSLKREEAKEQGSPFACARLLREHWRGEQMFLTVNHPGTRLLFHVADTILDVLGLGSVPPSVRNAYSHPQGDFWLPIHPALGPLLGLPFATKERRYRVYATSLTHSQYVGCYLACRQHGVTDLVRFLAHLPPEGPDARHAAAAR